MDHRDTRSSTSIGRESLSNEKSASWGADGKAAAGGAGIVVIKFVTSILLSFVVLDVLIRGLWRWSRNLLSAVLASSWLVGRIAAVAGRIWLAGAASTRSLVAKSSLAFLGELTGAVGWAAATMGLCYLINCCTRRGQAIDEFGRKKGADCLVLMEKIVRNQEDFSEDLRVKILALISEEKAGKDH